MIFLQKFDLNETERKGVVKDHKSQKWLRSQYYKLKQKGKPWRTVLALQARKARSSCGGLACWIAHRQKLPSLDAVTRMSFV